MQSTNFGLLWLAGIVGAWIGMWLWRRRRPSGQNRDTKNDDKGTE